MHKADQKKRAIPVWLQILTAVVLLIMIVVMEALFSPKPPDAEMTSTLTYRMTYEVINTYPHDPTAFTQGLIYRDGYLYESTGLYGRSSLRKVDLETGEVIQQIDLAAVYFAEGLTLWEDRLIQLTWREGTGFIYSRDDLSLQGQFEYATEGWGLTDDGKHLILSDGTPTITFLNPENFEVIGSLQVSDQGTPIWNINELEFIKGEIYANIWQTDDLVRINPATGDVMGWINLSGILPEAQKTETTDVLNGIAYDHAGDRLFVTGKLWPAVYEIRLVPTKEGQ